MAENYVPTPEDIQRLLQEMGGLNLAGQQATEVVPDGSYGFYSPDFSYGSYKMPYEDPTYRSGFEYARTIAGGMPFEDVVAPGMSFSPDQPMGYTQADLKRLSGYRGEGPAPVMPKAPTKGISYSIPNQMPFAPPGVAEPTRLDENFQPIVSQIEEPVVEQQTVPGLFMADENLKNFQEIIDQIDLEEVAKIDIDKIDIPESVSLFSDILKEPVIEAQPITPSIFDQPTAPVMPTGPMEPMVQPINEPVIPAQTLPQNIFANIPKPQPLPMPVIPNVQTPMIPSFVQPNIDEIVRPISRQGKFLPQQPGLFQLV